MPLTKVKLPELVERLSVSLAAEQDDGVDELDGSVGVEAAGPGLAPHRPPHPGHCKQHGTVMDIGMVQSGTVKNRGGYRNVRVGCFLTCNLKIKALHLVFNFKCGARK